MNFPHGFVDGAPLKTLPELHVARPKQTVATAAVAFINRDSADDFKIIVTLGELDRHQLGGVPNTNRPRRGMEDLIGEKTDRKRSGRKVEGNRGRDDKFAGRTDIVVREIVNRSEQE